MLAYRGLNNPRFSEETNKCSINGDRDEDIDQASEESQERERLLSLNDPLDADTCNILGILFLRLAFSLSLTAHLTLNTFRFISSSIFISGK